MKKILLLILILFISSSSFSQTKEETTEWLNQNLSYYNEYSFFVPDMTQIIFNESFSTSIVDGFMQVTYMDIKKGTNFTYFIVELKSLKYIKIKNGEFVNYTFLGSKKKEFIGEELIFEGDYIYYTNDSRLAYEVLNRLKRPGRNAFSVKVKSNDIKVLQENLSERIVKAFTHLVNLYGGSIVSNSLF